MHCNQCGKKKTIAESLCEGCYLEQHPLLLTFKEVKVVVCPTCHRYFSNGKWKPKKEITGVIEEHVKEALAVDKIATHVRVEALLPDKKAKAETTVKGEAQTTITGTLHKHTIKDVYHIPFVLQMKRCVACKKQQNQYFEGILQLRKKRAISKSLLAWTHQKVSSWKQKGVHVTKEKRVKGGLDLYITNQKYIRKLGKELQEHAGGELKIAAQLFSRNKQTARNVYRMNVLVRLPEIEKKDVIVFDDKLMVVSNVAKLVKGNDLKTGKRMSVKYEEICDRMDVLKKRKTQVVKAYPHIEVLHPDTYESVRVENAGKGSFKNGEKVKVVMYKDRLYIVG